MNFKTYLSMLVFACFFTINASGQSRDTSRPVRPGANTGVEEYDTFGYLGKDYALSVINGFKERSEPIYEKYLLHRIEHGPDVFFYFLCDLCFHFHGLGF